MEMREAIRLVAVAAVLLAAVQLFAQARSAGAASVSIVSDPAPGRAASHGLTKLTEALKARGAVVDRAEAVDSAKGDALIVAGLAAGEGEAARRLKALGAAVPAGPEALVIRRTKLAGRPAVLVGGSDDRGLMYALLDVADRVGWAAAGADPLGEVREAAERPYVPERALAKYTMHRACFESFFHDERYWARYFDTLARNRFNTFALLFGYENAGYFAPPYPYFFDVDGFAGVRVVGLDAEGRRKNLAMLNRVVEMAHDRGLSVTIGIWDHIYRGGVQGPKAFAARPTDGLVWGLTKDNLVAYTTAALARFFREVPHFDAVQFRMHGESGLKREEMKTFWENVYRVVKESRPGIRFDARAKNFPDSLIDKALAEGIHIRMCTKYWMEQAGLPFHPTHVHPGNQHDRRHGYGDMLRYPQRYKMHWRLWTSGTMRVLLWGDPEYVRRFAASTHLYDGEGFEVTEPMGTKMQEHPHDEKPFELLADKHRWYDWEFERYWHFFQVFGRVGYDPNTPAEVWRREFVRRFGEPAGPTVEKALHRASGILPRIVAYSYPYNRFPTTRGWAERQRMEDLPAYARALPSDTQQFLSMGEAAECVLTGEPSAKVSPEQSSRWFAQAARDVLELAGRAEKAAGAEAGREFVSTVTDLKMLAHLARYHSWRALGGVRWALYERSGDLNALDDAIGFEARAVAAWEDLVRAAGDVYTDDVALGGRGHDMAGHWRDELVKLRRGLAELKKQREAFQPKAAGNAPAIAHVPVRRAAPGEKLLLRATVTCAGPVGAVRVALTDAKGATRHVPMEPAGKHLYRAELPAAAAGEALSYNIEAAAAGGRSSSSAPVAVKVTLDDEPPVVEHERIAGAPVDKSLTVAATVRDPSGVAWVRLRYRGVNQYQDYRTLPMQPAGEGGRYEATVPVEHVNSPWDFMYLIEAMDTQGNGRIWPDLEVEQPYVIVKLLRAP